MIKINLTRWWLSTKYRCQIFSNIVKSGNFTKALNYLHTNINMALQPERASNSPTILVIDPGNVCNLSCALCITGQKKSKRPPKLLTFEEFRRIIDQLGKKALQVDLYNWGEPLLNKDLFKMISYAKKTGLRVETSSNLQLLTPEKAQALVKSGLDRLIISLHGSSQETTEAYMKGSNFQKVRQHMSLLIKVRRQMKSLTPSITWRYVVNRYNEKGIEEAKRKSKIIGVDVLEFLPLKLDIGFDPKTVIANIKTHGHWISQNKTFALYDPQEGKIVSNESNCFWPWEMVAINSDGTIQPCCQFSNPEYDFGNIFKEPFDKIWNGPIYRLARKIIHQKNCNEKSTVCGLCIAAGFIGR